MHVQKYFALSLISNHTLSVTSDFKINCKALSSAIGLLFLFSQPEQ